MTRAARRSAVAAVLMLCAAATSLPAQELPRSALAVHQGGGWRTWWRSADAPGAWRAASPTLAGAVEWRSARPGLEWSEVRLSGRGEAWRVRVVLLRLDPKRFELRLREATRAGGTLGAWTTDSVPAEAALAFNAGQFSGGQPWGWVVRGGRETQAPGYGPLSMALVVDSAGGARLVEADSIEPVRRRGGIVEAFQSYPMLLRGDGEVPPQLHAHGRGVDVGHRDSRLALGELRDGRLLIALTRFEGLGGVLSELPFGLTTPEMAALMGALGCRSAMLLDGGLSGQLLLRDAAGRTERWNGLRRVPLGLEIFARPALATGAGRRG
jgi:hypothetical protein